MKTDRLLFPLKDPPLVMGMRIEMRWRESWRRMEPTGCNFRLYRPWQKKDGSWILRKLRDYRWVKFKNVWYQDGTGTWVKDNPDRFRERMKRFGEKRCDEKGWVFDPDATHNHQVYWMDDSFKTLLEMEILANRGR